MIISAPLLDNDTDWHFIGYPSTAQEAERVAEIHATNQPELRFYIAELKKCSSAVARTLEVG